MATTRERHEPPIFELSPEDGSAYYLIQSEEYGDELVQVPLASDGGPCWEDTGRPGDFGGGSVDWERGIEDDTTRERLRAIERRLADTAAALNPAQRDEVAAQSAVYPSSGVELVRAVAGPAITEKWDEGEWPAGAVPVEFHYREPADPDGQDRTGLEVTVFAADGSVVTSQDFG